MLIEFPEFEDFLMAHNRKGLLIKGKQFLDEGRIQHIHAFSGTEWDIFIKSESGAVPGYNVRIKIDEGRVTYHDCNCPGYRMMPLCKHIVAALYAIKQKNLYDPNIGEYETEFKEEEEEVEDKGEIEEENVTKRDNKIYSEAMEEEEAKGSKSQKRRELRRKPADNDLIDQELQCQVCHELVEHPILMPCHSHSVCQSCVKSSLKPKDENDKTITCPKCGVSGTMEEKVNLGLERVRQSIEKERRSWLGEKEKLQKEIESFKGESKGKENEKTMEKGKGKIMEEGIYKKIFEENDKTKLRNLANMAVEELKKRGEKLDDLKKALQGEEAKGGKKSAGKKDTSGKRGKPDKSAKDQENVMMEETNEGAEKYDLRDSKKVKTN